MDKAELARIRIFMACDIVNLAGEKPDADNICKYLDCPYLEEFYNRQCREYYIAFWRKHRTELEYQKQQLQHQHRWDLEHYQLELAQRNQRVEQLEGLVKKLEHLKLQEVQKNPCTTLSIENVDTLNISNQNISNQNEKVEITIGDVIIDNWDIGRLEGRNRVTYSMKRKLKTLTKYLDTRNDKILSAKNLVKKLKLPMFELLRTHKKLEKHGCKITQLPNGEYEYDFTIWYYSE